MVLLPDITVLQALLHEHPAGSLALLCLSLLFSFLYLRSAFRSTSNVPDRLLHIGLAVSSAAHFLLLAAFFLAAAFIRWYASDDRAGGKRSDPIFLWAFVLLAAQAILWTGIILLLARTAPELQISLAAGVRKLLSYPRVFEKFLVPVVQSGILPEFILVAAGAGLLFLQTAQDTATRRSWGFVTLLFLLCLAASSVAHSYYNHIRYFYYLYPLLLMLLAFLVVQGDDWLTALHPTARWAGMALLGLYLAVNVGQSWRTVVAAHPGMIEPFSYHRIRLDHKTCGARLKTIRQQGDYVLDFGRPNESAVYCGSIDACLRPELLENRKRDTHYITASRFFSSPLELDRLLQSSTQANTTVWLLTSSTYVKKGSWPDNLLGDLGERQVCQATDGVTALYAVPSGELQRQLALLR